MTSDLVLGGAPLGGAMGAVNEAVAVEVLEAAWEAGIRSFDTAPHYGAGLSERRIGRFLQQFPRDSFVLSTKVGRLLVDPQIVGLTAADTEDAFGFFGADARHRVLDYSADGVRRSLEESLDRMGLDRVDVALIHDPDEHMDQALGSAYPALHELREQGVIRSVGAGMNHVAPLLRFVRETDVDTIMLAGRCTLLDRSAAAELLPACSERAVAVVAVGVFNSGVLADPRPGATYDYESVAPDVLARAQAMERTCAAYDVPLRAAALQFPFRHPSVSAVAVGMRTAAEVRDNVEMRRTPIPASLWDELDSYAGPGV